MSRAIWKIRKAIESDAAGLTACMHAAYAPYTDRFDNVSLPPMNVDYQEEIRTCDVRIAESDAAVVGGLILLPQTDHMKIANVAVHPRFQGHGLGRGLMSLAEDEAIQYGYTEMRLVTHVLFTENIALYGHLGWSEIDRDAVRVTMRKTVSQ